MHSSQHRTQTRGVRTSTRWVAVFVSFGLIVAACTSEPGSTSQTSASSPNTTQPSTSTTSADTVPPSPASPAPSFDLADLPVVPAPTPLTAADPAGRAAELVAATSDDLADVGPGWMAVYAEFGLPVLDERSSAAPPDPFGPTWSEVWAIGQASRGSATTPFSEVGRVVILDNRPTPLIDPAVALADLRASAAQTADPARQTMALFVAGKAIANGSPDPLDPSTDGTEVGIDAASLLVISWIVIRDAVLLSAANTPQSLVQPGLASFTSAQAARRTSLPCSESHRNLETTPVVNWVISRIGSGLTKENSWWPGVVEIVVNAIPQMAHLAEKIGGIINWASALVSLIGTLALINSLHLVVSAQPPLIRRKDTQPGSDQAITATLTYNNKILDIDQPIACLGLVLTSLLGITIPIPADGAPVSGAHMVAEQGRNMPNKVEFVGDDFGQVRLLLDSQDTGTIPVRGHARSKVLPGSATEKADEFDVRFSSQVEETNRWSALNFVFDSVGGVGLVVAPASFIVTGPAAVGLAVDVLKLMHWSLGTRTFPFTDWESGGWRVDEPSPDTNYRYTATICDLDAPFTIFENEAAVFGFTKPFEQGGTYDFVPIGDGVYSVSTKNYLWDEQGRVTEGFTVSGTFPASVVYTVPSKEPAGILIPSIFPGFVPDLAFTLIPDPTVCDLPPDTRTRAGSG